MSWLAQQMVQTPTVPSEMVQYGRIGVTLKESGRYFEFSNVDKDSSAYKAGVRKGDVLFYVEVCELASTPLTNSPCCSRFSCCCCVCI